MLVAAPAAPHADVLCARKALKKVLLPLGADRTVLRGLGVFYPASAGVEGSLVPAFGVAEAGRTWISAVIAVFDMTGSS